MTCKTFYQSGMKQPQFVGNRRQAVKWRGTIWMRFASGKSIQTDITTQERLTADEFVSVVHQLVAGDYAEGEPVLWKIQGRGT